MEATKPPGKYDTICTFARVSAAAKGAVLVIYEGSQGSGLSVQCDARLIKALPAVLRQVADDIERDAGKPH